MIQLTAISLWSVLVRWSTRRTLSLEWKNFFGHLVLTVCQTHCHVPLPFLNRLISIVNDSMTHESRRFGNEDDKQQGIFLTPTALRSHHMEASFCLTHQKSTFHLRGSVGKWRFRRVRRIREISFFSSTSCGDAAFLSGTARGGFRGTHVAGASCSHAVADKAPLPGARRVGCFEWSWSFDIPKIWSSAQDCIEYHCSKVYTRYLMNFLTLWHVIPGINFIQFHRYLSLNHKLWPLQALHRTACAAAATATAAAAAVPAVWPARRRTKVAGGPALLEALQRDGFVRVELSGHEEQILEKAAQRGWGDSFWIVWIVWIGWVDGCGWCLSLKKHENRKTTIYLAGWRWDFWNEEPGQWVLSSGLFWSPGKYEAFQCHQLSSSNVWKEHLKAESHHRLQPSPTARHWQPSQSRRVFDIHLCQVHRSTHGVARCLVAWIC